MIHLSMPTAMSFPKSISPVLQTFLFLSAFILTALIGENRVAAQDSASSKDVAAEEDAIQDDVILVVGAPGEPEFGEAFSAWAKTWEATCNRTGLRLRSIGDKGGEEKGGSQREQLQGALEAVASGAGSRPLWLILIGHGTWDGTDANLNLIGTDVSAKTLDLWLSKIRRPLVVVNCTSSSGPFIDRLSGPGRVIVTATKSGNEQNFARFGDFFAKAFGSIAADLNHDDEVSAKEAFLKAVSEVEAFYEREGRLATEHAMLDDNNDRKGSSADLVSGRARTKEGASIDGELADRYSIVASPDAVRLSAEALELRDRLERELEEIRESLASDRGQLRAAALPVLLELGKLYAEAEQQAKGESETDADGGN